MPHPRTPFDEPRLLADLQDSYAAAREQYRALQYAGPAPEWTPRRTTNHLRFAAAAAIVFLSLGLLWHNRTGYQPVYPLDPMDATVLAATPSLKDFSPSRLRRPSMQRLRLSGRLQRPRRPGGKSFRLSAPRPPRPPQPAKLSAAHPLSEPFV